MKITTLMDNLVYGKNLTAEHGFSLYIEKYKKKYIGIPFNKNIFEDRLLFTKNVIGMTKDIFIIPEIKIYYENDTHFKNMLIKNNNDFVQDEFIDEQFLVINNNNSLIIISGCSHRGITNIIKTAVDYFQLPIKLVLGGFHFKDEVNEKTIQLIDILKKFNIKKIGVSHCTGVDKYSLLKEKLSATVFYNYTGNIFGI